MKETLLEKEKTEFYEWKEYQKMFEQIEECQYHVD